MKGILETVIHTTAAMLLFCMPIAAFQNPLLGFEFLCASLLLFGILPAMEGGLKYLSEGIMTALLLIALLLVFGILAYFQLFAYASLGLFGYIAFGAICLYLIVKIIQKF